MSYILDALKQNESAGQGPLSSQVDYQQEYILNKKLRFYRNLALSLGFMVTLAIGFFIGKTLQEKTNESVTELSLAQVKNEKNEVEQPLQTTQTQTAQPAVTQPVTQTGSQVANVQYQLVPVPVYTGVMPTAQMSGTAITQPMTTSVQNPQQNLATTPQAQNSDAEADLSEYKVVGYQHEANPETNALIDAFSEAFEQAQNESSEAEVISASSTSAKVSPLELMPDNFKSRIPAIQYQAHVYSSEPSRSWIKLNGKELRVGDNLNGLYVVEIAAEQVILANQGIEFSLSAMDDWQY